MKKRTAFIFGLPVLAAALVIILAGCATEAQKAERQAAKQAEEQAKAEEERKNQQAKAENERKSRIVREKAILPVSDDFNVAKFCEMDFFEAVASEGRGYDGSNWEWANYFASAIVSRCVSDVVFEIQQGTDIWFTTDDNAINLQLKADRRTGLKTGEKVRIYYGFILTEYQKSWNLVTIVRL